MSPQVIYGHSDTKGTPKFMGNVDLSFHVAGLQLIVGEERDC